MTYITRTEFERRDGRRQPDRRVSGRALHAAAGKRADDRGGLGDDGEVVTPATPIDGWHVNVRVVPGEATAPLDAYAVTPESPRRVWG